MVDYDWSNPSPVMLSGDDQSKQESYRTTFSYQSGSHRSRQLLHPYAQSQTTFADSYFTPRGACFHHPSAQVQAQSHLNYPFCDYRSLCLGFGSGSESFLPRLPAGVLDCIDGAGEGFALPPKIEYEVEGHNTGPLPRLGLGLGSRSSFSAGKDDFLTQLHRRPWAVKGEPGSSGEASAPRCAADGCRADLASAKHYNRRHKVCQFHSKASAVVAGGLTQRFCQQCSRFHVLSAFDNAKRSCRKRLADHNRRRRKSNGPKKVPCSSFESHAGSPHVSGVH